MPTSVEPQTWHRYGFGGPPEPWSRDEQRELDRLATSYYVDVLEYRRLALAASDNFRSSRSDDGLTQSPPTASG